MDLIIQLRVDDQLGEHSLGRGRTADVSHADEEDSDLLGHRFKEPPARGESKCFAGLTERSSAGDLQRSVDLAFPAEAEEVE